MIWYDMYKIRSKIIIETSLGIICLTNHCFFKCISYYQYSGNRWEMGKRERKHRHSQINRPYLTDYLPSYLHFTQSAKVKNFQTPADCSVVVNLEKKIF